MITDAYSHTGLPRFQTVADYRGVMERNGIRRAVLSAFDSSPDLAGIHAAFTQRPEVFRGRGVPLGNDRTELETAVAAQLAAGFAGLRLTESDVTERPWLLDMVARQQRIALIAGRAASPDCARVLLAALERHEQLVVLGCHFAGGGEPKQLDEPGVAALFAHPRFSVIFSRHGGYQPSAILAWAEAVLARTGWGRLLWGAEAPVLFWRNETMPQAIAWIDHLHPTEAERAAFLGGNADRIYFSRPVQSAPLELPFEPRERIREIPATMWMHGLPVRQDLAGRLVHSWLAAGGQGTLGEHLQALLDRALPD